jgi:hypothetical protein
VRSSSTLCSQRRAGSLLTSPPRPAIAIHLPLRVSRISLRAVWSATPNTSRITDSARFVPRPLAPNTARVREPRTLPGIFVMHTRCRDHLHLRYSLGRLTTDSRPTCQRYFDASMLRCSRALVLPSTRPSRSTYHTHPGSVHLNADIASHGFRRTYLTFLRMQGHGQGSPKFRPRPVHAPPTPTAQHQSHLRSQHHLQHRAVTR